jgi:hypothetical protein
LNLEQCKARAQLICDRTGESLAILNLNRVTGDLHVMREWDDRYLTLGHDAFVCKVEPDLERLLAETEPPHAHP